MKIRVLGGAREVGGSCIAIETEQCKVALDYGIKLDDVTDEYPKNFDAIIVSHAHLDHSGSLPRLSKSRNKQVILGSKITRDVTVELLKDMVKIQKTKGSRETYDESVVNKIRDSWLPTESLALPGMALELLPAGHVAGANMTGIRSEGKTILYTGDFCIHDSEILDGCNVDTLPKAPDVLISESTYGGKIRSPRNESIDQFFETVSDAMKRRRNILIPTFAFHRSQEMVKRIDQAMGRGTLPRYNAYTISNLAQKITAQFNANKNLFTKEISQQVQPFVYSHFKQIESTTEIEEPAIVVCTPGFGHAGASLSLLTQWAESEDTVVILTSGYLPPDSPLKLAQEKRFFRLNGEIIPVQAKFEQIELSGHADQAEIVQLIEKLKPKKTFLVHGDLGQAEALSKVISEMTEVCIPEKSESITI
jgi:Cft2 family RNA processing exonuclease